MIVSDEGPLRWYTVQTKPRQERVAGEHLARQGIEIYLPRVILKKRRNNQWIPLIEPLFPRYLFVYLDPAATNVAPIRSTRGVSGLVRFGRELTPVPRHVIDYLKKSEDPETGVHDLHEVRFSEDDPVEILDGPFLGLQGVFKLVKGEDRAMVLISLLGRQNEVSIKLDDLKKT